MKYATASIVSLFIVNAAIAQPSTWNLYVTTDDAPFTSQCGSGSVLDEHELAFVYLDLDQDGPDMTDAPPLCILLPGEFCYAGEAIFTYRNFPLSPDGTIHAPLFHGGSGYEPPQGTLYLYLRVFASDSSNLMYTSPVMSASGDGDTTYAIIPFAEWTCGPADVPRPPCHGDRAYMEFGWQGLPTEICFLSCQQGILELAVGQRDNAFRPPAVRFATGCDINCMPALSPVQNVWDWEYLAGIRVWFGTLTMRDNGCATAELLDSIPIARLDTLTVTVVGQSTLLEWNTNWESGFVNWELWQPVPWGDYNHHLADIPAANDPQGSSYNHVLTDAFQHGDNISYILAMVGADSQKYGAAYIRSTQFLLTEPSRLPLVRLTGLSVSPNPFNAMTHLRFAVSQRDAVILAVYDLLGRHITTLHDGMLEPGEHRFAFDASRLPSGIYFARVQAGEFVQTQKLMLLK